MNRFREELEELLTYREVPFIGIENTVAVDGITVVFNEREYVVRTYVYDAYQTTKKPVVLGHFRYSDTALEALTGIADMAHECKHWRQMPGFNVPEIVFAFNARNFMKGSRYWTDSDYMSMYAMYRIRCLNTNYESWHQLLQDSGTKAKFVGRHRNFLRQPKEFAKVCAEEFRVRSESSCRPINCLPTDPNMVLAWYERRQKLVTTNAEDCKALGIDVSEERPTMDKFLVLVPREDFAIPLLFPHEWN